MGHTESKTSTTGGVEYNGLLRFPKFFFLLEHDNVKAVITLPDAESLAEVEYLCRAAISECDHKELGSCMSIKPATMDDWLEWH